MLKYWQRWNFQKKPKKSWPAAFPYSKLYYSIVLVVWFNGLILQWKWISFIPDNVYILSYYSHRFLLPSMQRCAIFNNECSPMYQRIILLRLKSMILFVVWSVIYWQKESGRRVSMCFSVTSLRFVLAPPFRRASTILHWNIMQNHHRKCSGPLGNSAAASASHGPVLKYIFTVKVSNYYSHSN